MDTARITIIRFSDRDIKIRSLDVYVDGQLMADVPFGKKVTFDVAAGSHVVKLSNRLFSKTLNVEVGPDETVTIEAGNSMKGMGGLWLGLGLPLYTVFASVTTPGRGEAERSVKVS